MLAIQGFVTRNGDNAKKLQMTKIGTMHTFQTPRELEHCLKDMANEIRDSIELTAVENRGLRIFVEFKDIDVDR